MVKFEQLRIALAAAKGQLDLILKKHPHLEDRLVLSLSVGQTGIDSEEIAKEFGSAFCRVDSVAHRTQCATQLNPNEEYQIEIRFCRHEYELNWKLQADDLIDRNLMPETKAFIRLGLPPFDIMMESLAEIQSKYEARKS